MGLDEETRRNTKLNARMGEKSNKKKKDKTRKPKPTPATNTDGWEEVVDVEDLIRRLLGLKACTV